MNKNGLTLVELLGIIVVLAIVMGIAVYSVTYVTNKGKMKVYETHEKSLKGAAENYLTDDYAYNNGLNFPNVYDTKKITYQVLRDELFIDELKDPKGGSCNSSYVLVTRGADVGINFSLDYKVCLICDNYTTIGCES